MKFNWKKLYSALDKSRKQSYGGVSWRNLAKTFNVTPSLFTRISQGKPTSVANLTKILDLAGRFEDFLG